MSKVRRFALYFRSFGLGSLLILALIINVVVHAAPGDLDPDFGNNGVVTTDIMGSDFASDVVIQSDNKILVVGESNSDSNGDIVLVRYNSDGSLDMSFGNNGVVITDIDNRNNSGASAAIQPDGKILVGGRTHNGNNNDFVVLRYLNDGSLDSTFGNNGYTIVDIGGDDFVGSIALQPDGKMVVVGSSESNIVVTRFNSNGLLDVNFSGGGIVITDINNNQDSSRDVYIQSDGKIVVVGSSSDGSNADFATIRYNPDGSLDTGFGTDGVVTTSTPLGSGPSRANSVILDHDGKIIVAGGFWNGTPGSGGHIEIGLVRYNPNGSLDLSFNGNGILATNINAYSEVMDVALQANGKIVASGFSGVSSGGNILFATVRVNTDGNLDSSFGDNGFVTTAIGNSSDRGRSLAIQQDGKIVVAGLTQSDINNDFAMVRYFGDPVENTEPELSFNHDTGRPGSYFTAYAQNFPVDSPAFLTVNGQEIGTLNVDANGTVTFTLATIDADTGSYITTLSASPEATATVHFTLDANAPLRDREDFTSPIFDIPAGISLNNKLFLPIVVKE